MATEVAEREEPQRKKTNPVQFFREVRAEGRKVTWATWKETWVSTVMVVVMVLIAAVFFFVTDQLLRVLVQFVLSLGA